MPPAHLARFTRRCPFGIGKRPNSAPNCPSVALPGRGDQPKSPMPTVTAHLLLDLAAGYAGLGMAVGVAFLLLGLDRADPAARGAYAFRPLLLSGLVLLWPLVLWRWRALARG